MVCVVFTKKSAMAYEIWVLCGVSVVGGGGNNAEE